MRRATSSFVALVAATLLAAPATATAGSRSDLRAGLERALRGAGSSTGAYVYDLSDGDSLFALRPDDGRIPASVEKLYTTSAVFLQSEPLARIPTVALVAALPDAAGVVHGNLWLVGGGDPTLHGDDLDLLARRLVDAGLTAIDGDVVGDESLFDERRGGARTGTRPDADIGGLIGGLIVDRGIRKGRTSDHPARDAARMLAARLQRAGVTVPGTATGLAPAEAPELARVESPPLTTLAGLTNVQSDNYLAEMLLKRLDAQPGRPATTTGGARVVARTMAGLGLRPRVSDGSGLSRLNRTTPRQVVRLLRELDGRSEGEELARSLAVAGRTGTLRTRMRSTRAAGNCRAKTGTLRDVSALAGICRARNGHRLAFAVLGNRVSVAAAKRREDRFAVALTRYG